jgi:shikimate dehydrogenase
LLTLLDNGRLRASNTDWRGFQDDLAAHNVDVRDIDALILGTGGSSRAVDYALRQGGAKSITYVSRNKQDAGGIINYDALEQYVDQASRLLVINSTPVGMWPNIEPSPWPDSLPFPSNATLYDLIYNPPVTRLMQQAIDAGAQVIGGLGMLVRQGALSFEQWTAIKPPVDVMENAARLKLGINDPIDEGF